VTDPPLVSVVVPFWNVKSFLAEAIDSVLAQRFQSWELLLVDDGSTDGTTEVARHYAERLPGQVRYLEHEGHQNRGVCASRNVGVRNARGAFIAFLDADDVWVPEKLGRQTTLLNRHPEAAFVYGLSQWWYSWSGDARDSERDFVHRLGVPANTVIRPPELLWRWVVRQDAAIPNPSNILVRREVVVRVGAFEESFRGNVYEDQAFLAKIVLGAPVVTADECWDRYRQHPGSSVATAEREGREVSQRITFLAWLGRYLERQGMRGTPLWRSIVRQKWTYEHPRFRALVAVSRDAHQHLTRRAKTVVRQALPGPVLDWIRARRSPSNYTPPVGAVRFGSFRRLTPLSREFGYDRGQPVDRHYIERFLAAHRVDVRGRVLEVGDDTYTRRFGGDRVTRGDVVDVDPGNPSATLVADMARPSDLPADAFDCVILTQTLPFIYDLRAALATVHRVLKPGGVLLATVPGISQISRYDMDRSGDYWRFTTLSARRLCEEALPGAELAVAARGNVLSAAAFLYGLSAAELRPEELDYDDPDYQLLITIRAGKRAGS
jgi:glycosyltransferase involved in cell wall biosynthesis/SAM-dependent methyltransferase